MSYQTPGILLLELDADTLAREGNDRFVDVLHGALAADGSNGPLVRHKIRTAADLALLPWFGLPGPFAGVALIGHSNPMGVRVAPDRMLTWGEVAETIGRFQPRSLLLVNCFAGLTGPTDTLFAALPSLEVVYGSPLTITGHQVLAGTLGWGAEARGTEVRPGVVTLVHALNVVGTGGLVMRRTRQEYESLAPADRILDDVLAIGGRAIVEALKAEDRRARSAARRGKSSNQSVPESRRVSASSRGTSGPASKVRSKRRG